MKAGTFAALVLISAIAATAVCGSPNDQEERNGTKKSKEVFVTGSRIPQKLKVKSIGTTTASEVRVYKRREIDQSGRFTTEGVLALDPSVKVISGGAGGGR
jgi:outer membrane cobalamin receptor